jgi:SP family facilitated glucose transporter-like MFS transporter 8
MLAIKTKTNKSGTLGDSTPSEPSNLYFVLLQAKRELEQLTSQNGSRDHENLTQKPGTTLTRRCCQDISKPHILKPLIIVSVFYFIQIISGTYLLIFYAGDIITHAGFGDGLGLDRFLIVVVTAATRLLFAVVTCFLLRCIGRRPLLLIVGSLHVIAALSVGMFLYTKNVIKTTDYEFPACKPIIIASILAYVATNTCTYFTMPGTAMAELLPVKIRGYACVYVLAGADVVVFVTTKFFPWLSHLLGMHGVFGIFGVTTAIGTFVMYLLLPESIGMSAVQIDNYFRQPNILWVGRNMRLRRAETEPKTEYHEMRVRS